MSLSIKIMKKYALLLVFKDTYTQHCQCEFKETFSSETKKRYNPKKPVNNFFSIYRQIFCTFWYICFMKNKLHTFISTCTSYSKERKNIF